MAGRSTGSLGVTEMRLRRLVAGALIAIPGAATGMELALGNIYCVSAKDGHHLLKVVAIEGDRVFTRKFNPVTSCPAQVDDAQIAESAPNMPVPRIWVERLDPKLIGHRPVLDDELDHVREIKETLDEGKK